MSITVTITNETAPTMDTVAWGITLPNPTETAAMGTITDATISSGDVTIGMYGDNATDAYYFYMYLPSVAGDCWWGTCGVDAGVMFQMAGTDSDYAGLIWPSASVLFLSEIGDAVKGDAAACDYVTMGTTPDSTALNTCSTATSGDATGSFASLTYGWHGVLLYADADSDGTIDSASVTILRQTHTSETADTSTSTDGVLRIAGDRVLTGWFFGPDSTNTGSTAGVAFTSTLLPTLVTTGATAVAAGMAVAASVAMMAF